jgi:SdrD B-like domain
MTTGDRLLGRGIALVGLAFGAAYLGWRILATLGGVPFWLAAVALLVEVVGFVGVIALVWALWRPPALHAPKHPSTGDVPDIDVLVRCSGQDGESLRATLLASRHLGSLHVLDLKARPEIAALTLDADAVYIATDPEDLDGMGQALFALAAPTVLLLEAGDVPRPDIVATLLPWLDDPDVAIVQGAVISAQRDSAEHDAGGRHDKEFDRRSLLPSLGARGVAAFTGSGALLRRAALFDLPIGHATRPMVQAEITAGLFRKGWRIVAPGGDAVVAAASFTQPDEVESMHACEASGAMHLLNGPNGALRVNSLSFRHRLALIALAARPLSGIRRSVVVGVLLAALLSGSMPFHPSPLGLFALWAPSFVLTSVGLWVMSEGSLRPGDRLRASMRLLGASWRGVLSPNGRPEGPQYSVAGAFGVHHGVASAAAVAAISVVVGLRGVSDRLTHTLEPLPFDQTAGLLVVVLWSLGGGLDALRLLARRAQTRRATRVASSLPSTFGDRTALVVDLTPHGAAVISEIDLSVGARDQLGLVLPTTSGVVTANVPVTVRNVRADFSGERRYGVEFGTVDAYVAEALAEYCVVQPAVELLGGAAVDPSIGQVRPLVVLDERALLPRRFGLRVAALLAVAGALASSIPTSAEASDASTSRLTGHLVAGTDGAQPAGALVTVVCAVDDGGDSRWGTSDDLYSGPVSAIVAADGSYDVASTGEACWMTVAPPSGYMLQGDTSNLESLGTPQVLDLSSTTIVPIAIVAAADPASTGSASPASTGHIDDVVWSDADADGVLDDNESPLAGVTVALLAANGTVYGTATTSVDGHYAFTNMPVGDYRISVSNLPNGMVSTSVLGVTDAFRVETGAEQNLAIGLRPARTAPPASAVPDALGGDEPLGGAPGAVPEQLRLLPNPATAQLATVPYDDSPAAALLVVLLATLMGLSVVAGSVRPGRSTLTRRLLISR